MNSRTQIITTQNSSIRMMLFVVLFVLLSNSMFSQNSKSESSNLINDCEISLITSDIVVATNQPIVKITSTMNIVSWFMGTKQSPNANHSDKTLSAKKQMINSGIAPNRLLFKAFLKKVSNYNTTLV